MAYGSSVNELKWEMPGKDGVVYEVDKAKTAAVVRRRGWLVFSGLVGREFVSDRPGSVRR